jgi:hypothetical protein
MVPANPCPAPESLQHLLDGTASQVQQAELTQHLEGCASCRAALDKLATEDRSLGGLARELRHEAPAPEPGLQRVLQEAAGASPAQTQAEAGTDEDEGLAFLAPSSRPGHLGRLGHYEVQEVIGKGAFGIVLKALDEKLQRVVAIKVLAPQVASSGAARKRFTREAQAAAAVAHENVVTIHAVEDDHDPPYLVMQCVVGQSLQDKIDRQGPLGLHEVLRIGLQTAEGLAAAHKQGLVHRDVKPSNILLENGVERVKITDFGLARAVDDASLTQSGVIAGTPLYMSPEQAEGLAVDHRSDLFSLGTVLYAMCTGRAPFRASSTVAVLKRVVEDVPRPIREINPDVPDWLADVVSKLHAKKPADRYPSARAVADVLGQRLAELQAHGRVLPAPVETPKPASARRLWRTALVGVLLLGALGAAVALWSHGGQGPAPTPPGDNKDDKAPPVVVSDPKTPFVVLARDGRAEQAFPTLKDAVEKARSGDTIEVRGDGPFVMPCLDLDKKALRIQAGLGFCPRLTQARDGPLLRHAAFLHTNAALVLEGLTFNRLHRDYNDDKYRHFIYSSRAPLHVSHCRFIVRGDFWAVAAGESAGGAVLHSEFQCDCGAVAWDGPLRGEFVVENCLASTGWAGFVIHQNNSDARDVRMRVRRNTFVSTGVGLGYQANRPPKELIKQRPDPKAPELRLEVTDNVIATGWSPWIALSDETKGDRNILSWREYLSLVPRLIALKDERNVYSNAPPAFLQIAAFRGDVPFHVAVKDLDDWRKLWGVAKSTSVEGRVRFAGGDLRKKGQEGQFVPADFRLAVGSPGQGVLPGGKDLGADVDKVGPGKPYDEWKKAPEYQEWQKKAQEALAGK